MKSIVVIPIAVVAVLIAGFSIADDPKPDAKPAAAPTADASASASLSKEDLEKKFQETLTGAVLSGHFSSGRDTKNATPKEDKYTIESVTKVEGDTWLFKARIQYGNHDVTLPLPLRVVWAGDTPVITVDKSPMPGLGKYSARVLIYDGRYAGTWDGGDHGGTLWGDIKKEEKAPPAGN
jgi:hypothetical protein